MRIRKNANLSSYMNSHASGSPLSFQTHVCQLNQSPWDVIPFSPQQTSYPFHQFEDEDSFNGNGSLVDSIGAVESVASMMEDIDEKSAATIINNADENYANGSHDKKRMLEEYAEIKVETNSIKLNKKSHETKTWHFKNNSNIEAANSSREASVTTSAACAKKQEKIPSSRARRGKISSGKKGSGSGAGNNPYEFYYYSGFGPSWGKRRGSERVGELGNNSRQFLDDDFLGLDEDVSASPPRIEAKNRNVNNNNRFDYVDEDEEEEDEDEEEISGKKRMRKPVKARSLKSLM